MIVKYPIRAVVSPVDDVLYWREAILRELPSNEVEQFELSFNKLQKNEIGHVFASLALWQLEDKTYGLAHIRTVRRDGRLKDFCTELGDLLRKEVIGDLETERAYSDLFKRMEPVWSEIGIQKKKWADLLRHRLGFLGSFIVNTLTRGWWETWTWAIAVTHKRGRGQTSVLVWSWARATGGTKGSTRYDARVQALREHLLAILQA